ncbi:MAG: hypothetical protein AAF666_17780, partial [Pseudomonadota bacterium]
MNTDLAKLYNGLLIRFYAGAWFFNLTLVVLILVMVVSLAPIEVISYLIEPDGLAYNNILQLGGLSFFVIIVITVQGFIGDGASRLFTKYKSEFDESDSGEYWKKKIIDIHVDIQGMCGPFWLGR